MSQLPKSALVYHCPLRVAVTPLMVVNVHAINFELGDRVYKKRLEQMGELTPQVSGACVDRRRFQYLE